MASDSPLAARARNQSYDTDGLDNPTAHWLQKHVRAPAHPDWGLGRVMRWYPSHGGMPVRLRVMFGNQRAPKVVNLADVEIVADNGWR